MAAGPGVVSLTRVARRKYNRQLVIVKGINSQADMDLMDIVDLAKQNDGYQYLLVCINIFSRFVRCVPLKTKKGKDMLQGRKTMFKDGFKVNMVRMDRGMEFHSKEVNAYFKSLNIHHFTL